MTRIEFIDKIRKSEQPFSNNFSHLYGSDYYSVNGIPVRISDHAKSRESLGYTTYNQGNDFRNYDDAFEYLSSKLDMTDKDSARNDFYSKNEKFIEEMNENTFRTPYGACFTSKEAALNNWWRCKRDFKIS